MWKDKRLVAIRAYMKNSRLEASSRVSHPGGSGIFSSSSAVYNDIKPMQWYADEITHRRRRFAGVGGGGVLRGDGRETKKLAHSVAAMRFHEFLDTALQKQV